MFDSRWLLLLSFCVLVVVVVVVVNLVVVVVVVVNLVVVVVVIVSASSVVVEVVFIVARVRVLRSLNVSFLEARGQELETFRYNFFPSFRSFIYNPSLYSRFFRK